MFDFLMELAYVKRANDTFDEEHANHEMKLIPTIYDTPKEAERKTLTY